MFFVVGKDNKIENKTIFAYFWEGYDVLATPLLITHVFNFREMLYQAGALPPMVRYPSGNKSSEHWSKK
jgi:hypothetical protein